MGKKNALETVDLKDVEILAPGTWRLEGCDVEAG